MYTIDSLDWMMPPPAYRRRRWGFLVIPFTRIKMERPGPSLIATFRLDGDKIPRQLVWAPDTEITLEKARNAVRLYAETVANFRAQGVQVV